MNPPTRLSLQHQIACHLKNPQPPQDFTMRGHSPACDVLIARQEHVLVGISPFNSRFSSSYVSALLSWAHDVFLKVDILLPDEDSAALLLHATDVPAGKAIRKTRKELNRHRRILNACLEQIGMPASTTRIIGFNEFGMSRGYLCIQKSVRDAYENCAAFRSACMNMSHQAIRGRLTGTGHSAAHPESDPGRTATALPYIFAEMPFYLGTPDLLQVSSSVLAYHRAWPIGDALRAGDFPLHVNANQGHGIVDSTTSFSTP